MKVAVLPKKTANNIVTGTIELRFGDTTTLAGQREAASFAGSLLMAGTKTHTRQQLQDEFRKLNAQVNVSGGGGGGGGGRGGGGGGGGGGGLSSATRQHLGAGRELPRGAAAGGRNPEGAARIRRTSSIASRRSG